MKIVGVSLFCYDLRPRFGSYALSGGRERASDPCLVVCVTADTGLRGWGECATLGRAHVAAFPESETAAAEILARAVLGLDPRQPLVLQAAMNAALHAGRSAKSAIDMACWDIAAQAAGVPLSVLLGGKLQDRVRCWDSIPMMPPEAIADHIAAHVPDTSRVVQVKVGDDPRLDALRLETAIGALPDECLIVADANGGWGLQDAIAAVRNLPGRWTMVEQPCATLSDCLAVFAVTGRPMILDESIGSLSDLIEMKSRSAVGGVSIKSGKLGGLTQARLLRDAAVGLGLTVTVDDLWGGAITAAALAHLASGVPKDRLLAVTAFADLVQPLVAGCPAKDDAGYLAVPDTPGLGIRVNLDLIGQPIMSLGSPFVTG